MKSTLFLPSIIALIFMTSCARSSSNYQNALESLFDGDWEAAMVYLDSELQYNIFHIDARFLRAQIYYHTEEYARALMDVTFALDNYRHSTSVSKSSLFALQGAIYYDQYYFRRAGESYEEAVKLAVKDNKDKIQDYKFILAQSLYFLDDYDGAEKVYMSMLEDDPDDYTALVGIARNLRDKERYEDAIEMLEKAENCDPNYPSIYKFRMQIYSKQNKTRDAISAALTYYELDNNHPLEVIIEYLSLDYDFAIQEVKKRIRDSEDTDLWESLLSFLYQSRVPYEMNILI